ncbi:entericidin, EcnA/B family (plasmid) [Azospirillum argentinense]|uniref:Entericidin, EcnA/B family n=1 Tax=Azospirillum argentinense TaxID=2970906 RepID=A0A4D8PMY8_9PROT|nr:entericidin A/B family lipoprotein [Azospirillum argentinense]QCN97015.1 entericidin, EcnA/B family [Azospirillum argentinense]
MSRSMPFPVRQIALASFVMTFAALLVGCNTIEGAGQDVQAGGRAVERAAE